MNSSILQPQIITLLVSEVDQKTRIDKFLAQELPDYSRNFFKRLLEDGRVSINNNTIKKRSTQLRAGDTVTVHITPKNLQKDPVTIASDLKKFPVTILEETDNFLALNKPAGLLVHNSSVDPASTTLVDWVLGNRPEIKNIGDPDRPGIVHRLDRNTSGIILVAKTQDAYQQLTQLFKDRKIKKTYRALVQGHPEKTGDIALPIGRHPTQRHKMTTYNDPLSKKQSSTKIRESTTHYKAIEYFVDSALVEVQPHTGRTHQIRVHLNAIGHPVLGDEVYGKKSKYIDRHALHAQQIAFELDGEHYLITCEPPEDFLKLYSHLKT